MRTVKLLLGVQFRALFSGLSGRKRKDGRPSNVGVWALVGTAILYGIILLCFGIMAFSVFTVMALAIEESGGDMAFLPGIEGLVCFALCLFGSVFMTQNTLYSAKDNDLLLSLPITPTAILVSRMLLLLIVNYAFGAVIAVPALAVYLIFCSPTVIGALLFAFFFLLIPLLALAVSCLLGWLLAFLFSRIRRKNIVYTVIALVLFAAYMLLMTNMGMMMETMEENIGSVVQSVSPYISLFWLPAHAIADGAHLEGLAFVGISAAVFALTLLFLSKTYISIVTTKRTASRVVYHEKKERGHSTLGALIRKEISHFIGSWYYMFNEGIGIIFAPILGVAALASREKIASLPEALSEMLDETGVAFTLPDGIVGIAFACAFVLLSSMIIISAPSVSLEGKSLWIVRSMPLDGKTVLLSKVYAHYLITAPFFLVSGILAAVGASSGIVGTLALILLPQLGNLLCALLGVTFGVLFPRLDWNSETIALKSGAAVSLTMFGMMLFSMLFAAACIVPAIIGVSTWLILAVGILLLSGICAALYAYLAGPGARRFEKL